MKVMVLESGKIAYFGDPDEFEKSSVPAVAQLTHPTGSIRFTDTYIADPWSKARRPGKGFGKFRENGQD
jgi:hypothetical protein